MGACLSGCAGMPGLSNMSELQEAFNRDAGKVRLIVLLDPS